MLASMDRVGKAILLAFHWIRIEDPCFLNMDNAGGHGTKVAVEAYTELLKDKYNIVTYSSSTKITVYKFT